MVHIAAIVGAIWFWSWGGLALALGSYFVRMVIVTAAYHRYFSHKAFKTSRVFQFILAVLAQTTGMKGVIWWASHHRWHHKYSDTPEGRSLRPPAWFLVLARRLGAEQHLDRDRSGLGEGPEPLP